jgi:hypothetical protein
MRWGREAAHVGAGLSDDHLGGAAINVWDRVKQLQRPLERADLLLDPVRDGLNVGFELLDVREQLRDPLRIDRIGLAPGTCLMWAALANSISKESSST